VITVVLMSITYAYDDETHDRTMPGLVHIYEAYDEGYDEAYEAYDEGYEVE
jgi:hypothetical protein